MPTIELLYWDGCPSHPEALASLRRVLDELGGGHTDPPRTIVLREVATDDEAAATGFIGSPTLRVDGVDLIPPPENEPTGLTCRVYRRRDGRYSPIPDPADLREALERLLPRSPAEA